MSAERPSTSEIHDAALQRLSSVNQRYTQNRRRLIQALHEATDPRNIAELLRETTGLAQSSTYRNLAILEEAGIVHRIVTGDDHARFELTEAMTGTHHHHLVCTECGAVYDMELSDELEHSLHDELARVAAQRQFEGAHHRIDLLGTCTDCG